MAAVKNTGEKPRGTQNPLQPQAERARARDTRSTGVLFQVEQELRKLTQFSTGPVRRKGFAFTLDAVLGVIVATALLSGFIAFYEPPTHHVTVHHRLASDVAFILDAEGTVTCDGTDNDAVNTTINDLVPGQLDYTYNYTCFDVTGSSIGAATGNGNSSNQGVEPADDLILAVRPIAIMEKEDSGCSQHCAKTLGKIARLEVGISP